MTFLHWSLQRHFMTGRNLRSPLTQLTSRNAEIRSPRLKVPSLMTLSHSRFGHYFCSNLYGSSPRGPWGVKRCARVLHMRFGALLLPPKGIKFEKSSKLKKNVKKTLFSLSISNILQLGGNICAPNLKWHV